MVRSPAQNKAKQGKTTQYDDWVSSGGSSLNVSDIVLVTIPHFTFNNPKFHPDTTQKDKSALIWTYDGIWLQSGSKHHAM